MPRIYAKFVLGLDMEKEPDWNDPKTREILHQLFLGKMVTYPEMTDAAFYRVRDQGAAQPDEQPAPARTTLENEIASLVNNLETPEGEE